MTEQPEAKMATPRKRRRFELPTFYDVREMARSLMFLAALAGMVMADIWLAGKI